MEALMGCFATLAVIISIQLIVIQSNVLFDHEDQDSGKNY